MDIQDYLSKYSSVLKNEYLEKNILSISSLIQEKKDQNNRVFIAGNGASASIASHISNDLIKATQTKAHTFHDPALITCFGNDFGYENWIAEAVSHLSNENDLLILISSSGRSENIVRAALAASKKNIDVISLTGPKPSKELENNSKILVKVDSNIYNIIECTHMIILTAAIDEINMITLNGEDPR